jgi:isocitrate/isopropylmalate dehydrogenase
LKRERIEGTDFFFLRELTGGIYWRKGRKDNETALIPVLTPDLKLRLAKKRI